MKKILFFLSLLSLWIHTPIFSYAIVFVHIGDTLPPYLAIAVQQARLFDKTCDIYLIADQSTFNAPFLKNENVTGIAIQDLEKSFEHVQFLNNTPLQGFWRYASERFLYLHDFMEQYNVSDVIHLESDVMLYVDIEELMPIFSQHYNGIAAVFDNDVRCIPGFLYIANKKAIQELATCFAQQAPRGKNDMQILALFKNTSPRSLIDGLPIVSPNYYQIHGLESLAGHKAKNPKSYSNNIDVLNSVFDGAAIGQFLGGIDPIHNNSKPGFINESCLFNPSHFSYTWEMDAEGRKVPYAHFNNKKYRINNLHIHSKNLKEFQS